MRTVIWSFLFSVMAFFPAGVAASDRVVAQGYSFQIEMVYRCLRKGFAVQEVPIHFEDRIAGKSKVSEGEVRKALLAVLKGLPLVGRLYAEGFRALFSKGFVLASRLSTRRAGR